jgi:hypothetical protein
MSGVIFVPLLPIHAFMARKWKTLPFFSILFADNMESLIIICGLELLTFLEGLGKTTKNFSQDIKCPSQYLTKYTLNTLHYYTVWVSAVRKIGKYGLRHPRWIPGQDRNVLCCPMSDQM